MKPALILRTYAWLYNTILNYGPLTFRQINEMWMADKRLSDGEPMVRQTFARHRNDLEDILGVRIDCDKKHRYSIVSDQRSERNNWEVLLDSAINQMFTKGAEIHKKIILEPNFIENNYFMQILECMLRNVVVDFDYQQTKESIKHYQKVEPYYFRQCQEHWFLVGRISVGLFVPFCLDKILNLRRTNIKFRPKDGYSVKSCEEMKDFFGV